jgi:HSP20 family protein
MKLPGLWSRSDLAAHPYKTFRQEMENWLSQIDKSLPSLSLGAGVPAVNVAETDKAIEITAELPGVEEKDIKVSLEGSQLVVAGEKKQESKRDEKDWHVEERSFGSFYRSMSLPFTPGEGAIEAHLDKGVLHITVRKPEELAKAAKTIEIKTGAPPQA